MSKWTHAICDNCWDAQSDMPPVKMKNPDTEICCFCGAETKSGIYIRCDPAEIACHDTTGIHAKEA